MDYRFLLSLRGHHVVRVFLLSGEVKVTKFEKAVFVSLCTIIRQINLIIQLHLNTITHEEVAEGARSADKVSKILEGKADGTL